MRLWRERKKSSPDIAAVEAGGLVSAAIESGAAFMVGRGGWMESYAAGLFFGRHEPPEGFLAKFHRHAGVFPPGAGQLGDFSRLYLGALASADLLGLLQSPFEGWLLGQAKATARRCSLKALEPYFSENPWSASLSDRRVLVVHPFVESISWQYRNHREALFNDPRVLPRFDLLLVKAPQTMCGATGGFSSWSEALADLQSRVESERFDVALVGCGAYGLPLAAFIKQQMHKPVVHLGGATQLLFGVSGLRWKERPEFAALMNDFWRPPSESERPPGWKDIEGGCYW